MEMISNQRLELAEVILILMCLSQPVVTCHELHNHRCVGLVRRRSLFFETQGCILKVPLQSKMRSSSCLSFEHRHKPAFTFMCSDFMITNSWEAGPHPIFSTHKYDVETNTENALFLQLNVLKSVNVLTFWKFNEGKGKVAFWDFNVVFIYFM